MNPQRCVCSLGKFEVKFRLTENARMTPPDEHLDAALRKVKLYQMSQWVGNLTPAQANALVDAGATAAHHDIAWMKSGLQAGSQGARWFYFAPGPALRALLRARPARQQAVKAPAET
jgi:hypothetical protein